jgi:leucyl-tRNA synthetase
MPVDLYIGGAEHAVLHLLYSRFWHKVLYDAGFVSTKEPFQKLFSIGKILAYSFQDEGGKYYYPHQVEHKDDKWLAKDSGKPLQTQVEKMSKSRFNVVNPDTVVEEYGADSLRLYEMFLGPLDRDKPWAEEGVQGVWRFLRRVWSLYIGEDGSLSPKIVDDGGEEELRKILHATIKAVTEDIENLQFNTAISRMMEFTNAATKAEKVDWGILETFALLLAPFAPHLAEEVWERLGHSGSLAYEAWPEWDESLLVEESVKIPVQVQGKLRDTIEVSKDADKETILAAAKASEKVQRHLDGKEIVKEIYVPGRMVNLVVK